MAIADFLVGARALTHAEQFEWYALFATLYFAPTLLAMMNRSVCARTIGLINIVFGWTIVGWYISFAAALTNWRWRRSRAAVASH